MNPNRHVCWAAACVILAGAIHACAAARDTFPAHAKPLLLAFYHPWYGTPDGSAGRWHKWDSFRFPDRYRPERRLPNGRHEIASADYPLIGPYDQGDPEVVRWHFRLAKAAGIDGFLCSWWKFRPAHGHWAVHPEPFVVPHAGGDTLRNFLRAADTAKPEIVVVCSFNEWLETTQIEPSADWDDPYQPLKILARWRGKTWKQPPLPKGCTPIKP